MKKRLIAVLACVVVLLMIATACTSGGTEQSATTSEAQTSQSQAQTSESQAAASSEAPVYKIALSNSFIGNDWRQEMQKVAEVVAGKSPYAERVEFRIVNCENTPEAQSASIDALVEQGYDAILVDAASATALNPSLQRALDAGIVVVSFDQIVDLEGTYGVETDWTKVPTAMAQYLVDVLNEEGNIVVDTGLAGAPISQQLYDGAIAVFDQYPNIHVVGTYEGQYAEGPAQQGMAAVLAATADIDAVYTQGYITPIVAAYKAAGRDCVPMSGFAYNGSVLALVDENVEGVIANNLPGLGAMALKVAVDVLDGETVESHIVVDPTFLVTDTSIDLTVGVEGELIEEGVNCFRDMPNGFDWPVLPPDFPVTVEPSEVVVEG